MKLITSQKLSSCLLPLKIGGGGNKNIFVEVFFIIIYLLPWPNLHSHSLYMHDIVLLTFIS